MSSNIPTVTTRHVEPTDDLRHAADSTGRMRDSLFWQTTIPEHQLGCQVYLYLTAGGKAGCNVVIWSTQDEPLIIERIEGHISATADLDDFTFKGLRLVQPEFGKSASLRYHSKNVSIAFDFKALHAPFSYRQNSDGIPQWFAVNRFEQTGWVTGSIEFGGRRIELNRIGHRDRSWGNRNWGVPQHWKWFIAYTPDGSRIVNGWIWIARGEWGVAGYVVHNGKSVPIHAIRSKTSYRSDMAQQRLEATVIDVNGVTTKLTMEQFAIVKLPSNDRFGSLITEAACSATIDGLDAAGQFETHWSQSYINHLVASDRKQQRSELPLDT